MTERCKVESGGIAFTLIYLLCLYPTADGLHHHAYRVE